MARACSASLNTKLEVRNSGVVCSRKGVLSWCPRIARVSNFSDSDIFLTVLNYFNTMCNGRCFFYGLSYRTILFDRQTYSFPGFSRVYSAIKLKMDMRLNKRRRYNIAL